MSEIAEYIDGLTRELEDVKQKTAAAREILPTLPPEDAARVEQVLPVLIEQQGQIEEALAQLRTRI